MARSKSHKTGEENTKPNRGPIQYPYVVYASWRPPGGELRWLILKFQDLHGARNMIEGIRGDDTYEWKKAPGSGYKIMRTATGVELTVRNDAMFDDILEIEYDQAEKTLSQDVSWFRYRRSIEPRETEDSDDSPPPSRKPKLKSAPRPSRSGDGDEKKPRVKVDRAGKISANDIATELGVEGREVRGVLRAMKLEKPSGGWLFDETTADDIRNKVKTNLKKKKK